MSSYRRFCIPGATWFFTVNLSKRHENKLLVNRIDVLRAAFAEVKNKHPFRLDGIVILPEHLHCILSLPTGDADYSTRWGLIKGGFSRNIETGETISKSRRKRGERGLWQRRFWDHLIRDELDFQRHLDYIHWNPVKHGWVSRVKDWPHSSFHKFVRLGLYPEDWCSNVDWSDFECGEYFQ